MASVGQHQAVVLVIEGKTFRDALDGIDQALTRLGDLAQVVFLDLDSGIAKYPERFRHAADLVTPRGWQIRSKVSVGDGQHAVAQRGQTGNEVAADIKPDDKG